MILQKSDYNNLIAQVRNRLRTRTALRGAAITLGIAAISLILSALAAQNLKGKSALLIALRIAPFLLTAASALVFLAAPLRKKVSDIALALLVEEKCSLDDRIVTAIEYGEDYRGASPAIVERLKEDAKERSGRIDINNVVDPRPSFAFGAASLISLAVIAALDRKSTRLNSSH